MTEPTHKPVIFLAFAQDRTEGGAYLRNLPLELDGIGKALQKARQAGLCEVVEKSNTTVEKIFDVFQEYQDRIAIFHYGGHADSYELLLESPTGEHAMAHSEGLVSFLAKRNGLQLVFLNGCCSQQQALDLTEAGLPAVIGTSQKIDDEVATNLSGRFYQGLAAGISIDRAWAEAVDQIKVEKGTSNTRALHWKGKVEASDRFPWEIYYRQGAEIVKDWNLPEAVENPLFGLPEIPKTYDLPETPFLFLKRYERQHAEIFFGRSYYIRDLYNRVSDPNSPPVILLYGQSGVGKSSLFDAGLNPRLEKDYKVIYIRRIQEKGLAGTLKYALEQALAALSEPSHDFPEESEKPAAESPKTQTTLSHLEAAAENASDDLKQEIAALIQRLQSGQQLAVSDPQPATSNQHRTTYNPQQATDNELLSKWQTIEARTSKPLILILDQVEELYTRPNKKFPDELADFLVALRSIFGSPAQRPSGRLILGYRKEYHPEIEEGFKTFLLPRATVFLEPLRRKDILEVFRGVSQTSALKQFYNLSVEDDLPVIIADDLLEDKESPVAPVLQILLTKMWNAAKKENSQSPPRFTVEQYQQFKKDGIAMGEFFAQQMEQLRTWQPEVVDSGLALDVLHFHVTALGTAGSCSLKTLREIYEHRQEIIDELVAKCQELYLLTEAHSAQHTGLTHDTLAPVVAKEYHSSDRFGQRAARILNSKMADFSEDGGEVWLDEADLALVEKGERGMRKLNEKEEQLLELSRVKRRKRQRLRKRLWAGGVVMLVIIVATAIMALVQWKEAKRQAAIADSNAAKFFEQKQKADDLKNALDKEILAQAKAIAELLARKILENPSRSSILKLGAFDSGIPVDTLQNFIVYTQQLTGGQYWSGDKLRGDKNGEWIDFQKLIGSKMTVAETQQFLKNAGFLSFGKIDGICGYSTTSSIRLFQEYVRTVEGQESIGFPDGKLHPNAEAHVKRWTAGNKKADWTDFSSAKPSPEYAKWMELLGKVKQKYAAAPTKMLQLVNQFSQPSDTRKVADWDFDPNQIHLVGIRRNEAKLEASARERKFDDVFILLINGLAFKFFGSTDPGETSNSRGAPFLVNGQHIFRLGWIKLSDLNRVYSALQPLSSGVLVVRSKDMALTEADLAEGLERADFMRIHWGGKGTGTIGFLSEGSQVIVGKGYINHNGMTIDCSRYAAPSYSPLGTVVNGVYQTRGAYTILMDLIFAFQRGDDYTVNYMLLNEQDLDLSPEIGSRAAEQILREITGAN